MFESCYRNVTTYPGPSGTESFNILDSGFWLGWSGLNQLERDWLLANPGKAWEFYQNVRKAEVSSLQRYGGDDPNNLRDEGGTNQNAYKHAYLAALHTLSWGPSMALDLMNAHEGGPNTPGINAQMDYFNNALGINTINFCGCEGETLRGLVQSRIAGGEGRRIVYGNSSASNTLIPTTGANIDND
jgi:hypothetical protein